MAVIGFRCYSDGFAFVVLEGTQANPKLVGHQRVSFPKNNSEGANLAWTRRQVGELLAKHKVANAAIKRAETNARRKSLPRAQVEGVVKEAVYAALDEQCVPLLKSQIKAAIPGFAAPARYLEEVLSGSALAKLNTTNYLDAACVAIAALPPE